MIDVDITLQFKADVGKAVSAIKDLAAALRQLPSRQISVRLQGVDSQTLQGLRALAQSLQVVGQSAKSATGTVDNFGKQTARSGSQAILVNRQLAQALTQMMRATASASNATMMLAARMTAVTGSAARLSGYLHMLREAVNTSAASFSTGSRVLDLFALRLDRASMFAWKFMIAAIPLQRISWMIAGSIGGITAALFGLGRAMGSVEQIKVGLESLLGSAEAAERVFEEIRELAKATPYNIQQIAKAYRMVLASGLRPFAREIVTAGAMLAALQEGQARSVARAVNAILDVYGRFPRRLRETYQILPEMLQGAATRIGAAMRAAGTDVDAAAFRILDSQRRITNGALAAAAATALALEWGGTAFGKYADTIYGRWERLVDQLIDLGLQFWDLIQPLISNMISMASAAVSVVSKIKGFFDAMGRVPVLRTFVSLLKGLVTVGIPVAVVVGGIAAALLRAASAWIYLVGIWGSARMLFSEQTRQFAELALLHEQVGRAVATRHITALRYLGLALRDELTAEALATAELSRRAGAEQKVADITAATSDALRVQSRVMEQKVREAMRLAEALTRVIAQEIQLSEVVSASQLGLVGQAEQTAQAAQVATNAVAQAAGAAGAGAAGAAETAVVLGSAQQKVAEYINQSLARVVRRYVSAVERVFRTEIKPKDVETYTWLAVFDSLERTLQEVVHSIVVRMTDTVRANFRAAAERVLGGMEGGRPGISPRLRRLVIEGSSKRVSAFEQAAQRLVQDFLDVSIDAVQKGLLPQIQQGFQREDFEGLAARVGASMATRIRTLLTETRAAVRRRLVEGFESVGLETEALNVGRAIARRIAELYARGASMPLGAAPRGQGAGGQQIPPRQLKLPGFQEGGYIPPDIREVIARLHGGELVLSREQVEALRRLQRAGVLGVQELSKVQLSEEIVTALEQLKDVLPWLYRQLEGMRAASHVPITFGTPIPVRRDAGVPPLRPQYALPTPEEAERYFAYVDKTVKELGQFAKAPLDRARNQFAALVESIHRMGQAEPAIRRLERAADELKEVGPWSAGVHTLTMASPARREGREVLRPVVGFRRLLSSSHLNLRKAIESSAEVFEEVLGAGTVATEAFRAAGFDLSKLMAELNRIWRSILSSFPRDPTIQRFARWWMRIPAEKPRELTGDLLLTRTGTLQLRAGQSLAQTIIHRYLESVIGGPQGAPPLAWTEFPGVLYTNLDRLLAGKMPGWGRELTTKFALHYQRLFGESIGEIANKLRESPELYEREFGAPLPEGMLPGRAAYAVAARRMARRAMSEIIDVQHLAPYLPQEQFQKLEKAIASLIGETARRVMAIHKYRPELYEALRERMLMERESGLWHSYGFKHQVASEYLAAVGRLLKEIPTAMPRVPRYLREQLESKWAGFTEGPRGATAVNEVIRQAQRRIAELGNKLVPYFPERLKSIQLPNIPSDIEEFSRWGAAAQAAGRELKYAIRAAEAVMRTYEAGRAEGYTGYTVGGIPIGSAVKYRGPVAPEAAALGAMGQLGLLASTLAAAGGAETPIASFMAALAKLGQIDVSVLAKSVDPQRLRTVLQALASVLSFETIEAVNQFGLQVNRLQYSTAARGIEVGLDYGTLEDLEDIEDLGALSAEMAGAQAEVADELTALQRELLEQSEVAEAAGTAASQAAAGIVTNVDEVMDRISLEIDKLAQRLGVDRDQLAEALVQVAENGGELALALERWLSEIQVIVEATAAKLGVEPQEAITAAASAVEQAGLALEDMIAMGTGASRELRMVAETLVTQWSDIHENIRTFWAVVKEVLGPLPEDFATLGESLDVLSGELRVALQQYLEAWANYIAVCVRLTRRTDIRIKTMFGQAQRVLEEAERSLASAYAVWIGARGPRVPAIERLIGGGRLPEFQSGGRVPRQREGAVPVVAHAGELIIPARDAPLFAWLWERYRQTGKMPHFQLGGIVGAALGPLSREGLEEFLRALRDFQRSFGEAARIWRTWGAEQQVAAMAPPPPLRAGYVSDVTPRSRLAELMQVQQALQMHGAPQALAELNEQLAEASSRVQDAVAAFSNLAQSLDNSQSALAAAVVALRAMDASVVQLSGRLSTATVTQAMGSFGASIEELTRLFGDVPQVWEVQMGRMRRQVVATSAEMARAIGELQFGREVTGVRQLGAVISEDFMNALRRGRVDAVQFVHELRRLQRVQQLAGVHYKTITDALNQFGLQATNAADAVRLLHAATSMMQQLYVRVASGEIQIANVEQARAVIQNELRQRMLQLGLTEREVEVAADRLAGSLLGVAQAARAAGQAAQVQAGGSAAAAAANAAAFGSTFLRSLGPLGRAVATLGPILRSVFNIAKIIFGVVSRFFMILMSIWFAVQMVVWIVGAAKNWITRRKREAEEREKAAKEFKEAVERFGRYTALYGRLAGVVKTFEDVFAVRGKQEQYTRPELVGAVREAAKQIALVDRLVRLTQAWDYALGQAKKSHQLINELTRFGVGLYQQRLQAIRQQIHAQRGLLVNQQRQLTAMMAARQRLRDIFVRTEGAVLGGAEEDRRGDRIRLAADKMRELGRAVGELSGTYLELGDKVRSTQDAAISGVIRLIQLQREYLRVLQEQREALVAIQQIRVTPYASAAVDLVGAVAKSAAAAANLRDQLDAVRNIGLALRGAGVDIETLEKKLGEGGAVRWLETIAPEEVMRTLKEEFGDSTEEIERGLRQYWQTIRSAVDEIANNAVLPQLSDQLDELSTRLDEGRPVGEAFALRLLELADAAGLSKDAIAQVQQALQSNAQAARAMVQIQQEYIQMLRNQAQLERRLYPLGRRGPVSLDERLRDLLQLIGTSADRMEYEAIQRQRAIVDDLRRRYTGVVRYAREAHQKMVEAQARGDAEAAERYKRAWLRAVATAQGLGLEIQKQENSLLQAQLELYDQLIRQEEQRVQLAQNRLRAIISDVEYIERAGQLYREIQRREEFLASEAAKAGDEVKEWQHRANAAQSAVEAATAALRRQQELYDVMSRYYEKLALVTGSPAALDALIFSLNLHIAVTRQLAAQYYRLEMLREAYAQWLKLLELLEARFDRLARIINKVLSTLEAAIRYRKALDEWYRPVRVDRQLLALYQERIRMLRALMQAAMEAGRWREAYEAATKIVETWKEQLAELRRPHQVMLDMLKAQEDYLKAIGEDMPWEESTRWLYHNRVQQAYVLYQLAKINQAAGKTVEAYKAAAEAVRLLRREEKDRIADVINSAYKVEEVLGKIWYRQIGTRFFIHAPRTELVSRHYVYWRPEADSDVAAARFLERQLEMLGRELTNRTTQTYLWYLGG